MKTLIGFMVWAVIVIVALTLTLVSIVALTCGAAIYLIMYAVLYSIGAVSVLLVSVYMWWYSLLIKVVHLDNE